MSEYGCGAKGRFEDWRETKLRYPVCNRPEGHEGPHRRYSASADVLAEWEVPVQ